MGVSLGNRGNEVEDALGNSTAQMGTLDANVARCLMVSNYSRVEHQQDIDSTITATLLFEDVWNSKTV